MPWQRDPVLAWIGLGANLGAAADTINRALSELGRIVGTELVSRSSLYVSAPLDAAGPDFFNAVAGLRTRLTAPDLLQELWRIELAHGRDRPYRHAPRTLDLDLLLYGEAQIHSERLTVPHPRMKERAFVLLPLAEVSPALVAAAHLAAVADQPIRKM